MVSKEKQNSVLILDKLPSNIVKEAIIILSKEFDFEYDYNKSIKENVINEGRSVSGGSRTEGTVYPSGSSGF